VKRFLANFPYRLARRIGVAVVGGIVVLVGIVMLVVPGPAFIVIPAGLSILALEFAWPRTWLKKMQAKSKQAMNAMKRRKSGSVSKSPK
jgi:tellurite resistance protein TerC